MRGKRFLRRLPVAGRALRTIDDLRRERDGLRRERDRLLSERDELRARLGGRGGASGDPVHEVLSRPSLLARTETLRRVRAEARRIHGRADPVWAFNSKLAGAALARELGVRTPEIIASDITLDEVSLPDRRCLLKPLGGAAVRGVTPLVPAGRGRWIHLFELDRGPLTWDEIRADLELTVARGKITSSFLVEELIPGRTPNALPIDWKCICVGGRLVLTWARDARNRRSLKESTYRYFDRDWEDLGPVRNADQIDPTIAPPEHAQEVVQTAERIAAALPTPFVRIDLYDTPDGVVFGEITPQPGNKLWFGPELDHRFGRWWDEVEARSWDVERA